MNATPWSPFTTARGSNSLSWIVLYIHATDNGRRRFHLGEISRFRTIHNAADVQTVSGWTGCAHRKVQRSTRPPLRSLGAWYGNMMRHLAISTYGQANMTIQGCLLFSAFEWEAAAELFTQLSRSIPVDLYSTVCLLNAAMIHARLGDFPTASQTLADARHVEELLPITLCLMGHIEYELKNWEKAEDCLNIALQAIKGTDTLRNYRSLGLDFVLCEDQINLILDVFPPAFGSLGTIPADNLFEAPPRKKNLMPASSWGEVDCRGPRSAASSESLSSRSFSSVSTIAPLVPRSSNSESGFGENRSPCNIRSVAVEAPLVSECTTHGVCSGLDNPTSSRRTRLMAGYSKVRAAGKSVLQRRSTRGSSISENTGTNEVSPRDPPSSFTRPVARDARPVGNKTDGLSDFIHHLPTRNLLAPRDPRVRPDSTGDLAEFLRDTAPGHIGLLVNKRISVGSILTPSPTEPRESGSVEQLDSSRASTLSSIALQSTPMSSTSRPASIIEAASQSRNVGLGTSDMKLSNLLVAERRFTASSESSWRSQDSDSMLSEANSQRFQMIHPALRADSNVERLGNRGPSERYSSRSEETVYDI